MLEVTPRFQHFAIDLTVTTLYVVASIGSYVVDSSQHSLLGLTGYSANWVELSCFEMCCVYSHGRLSLFTAQGIFGFSFSTGRPVVLRSPL